MAFEHHKTIEELLRAWDNGETIFTIELGGLGPGYEQAIQIAAVEFARACKDLTGMKNNDKASTDKFTQACEKQLREIDGKLGLSGAQFGAARWLAWQWCFNGGPAAVIERAHRIGREIGRDDQVIQCSKHFPEAP